MEPTVLRAEGVLVWGWDPLTWDSQLTSRPSALPLNQGGAKVPPTHSLPAGPSPDPCVLGPCPADTSRHTAPSHDTRMEVIPCEALKCRWGLRWHLPATTRGCPLAWLLRGLSCKALGLRDFPLPTQEPGGLCCLYVKSCFQQPEASPPSHRCTSESRGQRPPRCVIVTLRSEEVSHRLAGSSLGVVESPVPTNKLHCGTKPEAAPLQEPGKATGADGNSM